MKKIITLILSAFVLIAQCPTIIMASDEEVENETDEKIEVRIDNEEYKEVYLEADGKVSILRINKNTGDITIEVSENGKFVREINNNLYSFNNAVPQSGIKGEVIEESVSGWGIFLPNVESIPYSLRCPIEFQEEQGVTK